MTRRRQNESGFTAVELLATLFVAAAFLIAGYQLFSYTIQDGGKTRSESRASSAAYDYLRKYTASSTTVPCTPSTPLNNASITVDALVNTTMTITITCPSGAISGLSKVEAAISYNVPAQTIKYAAYTSSADNTTDSDITNGLTAWWKLNGNANLSVGTPNGTATNTTSVANSSGVNNMAYSFNGTSSKIVTNSTFGMGTTDVTLSGWIFNPTAGNNSGAFIKVGTTNGYGIGIGSTTFDNGATAGTKLVMLFEGIRWIPTTKDVGYGWHHVAMTINSAGVPSAYLDGALIGSYAGTGAIAPSTTTYIGSGVSTRFFNGSIDDVRMYNRTLSASEALNLYIGGAK